MNDEASQPEVVLVERRLDPAELRRLVAAHFEDMVKYVVDVGRGVAAEGGELHADEEKADGIEYTSLINIRPARGNRSMVIEDEGVRSRVQETPSP
jgi:hypothetical protein